LSKTSDEGSKKKRREKDNKQKGINYQIKQQHKTRTNKQTNNINYVATTLLYSTQAHHPQPTPTHPIIIII